MKFTWPIDAQYWNRVIDDTQSRLNNLCGENFRAFIGRNKFVENTMEREAVGQGPSMICMLDDEGTLVLSPILGNTSTWVGADSDNCLIFDVKLLKISVKLNGAVKDWIDIGGWQEV